MAFLDPEICADRSAFCARFGGIYEHSNWVAEQVFDAGVRPDMPREALTIAMRLSVEAAGDTAQLALLRAHPDLAGKLAKSGTLTDESTSEQASAGLDQCSDAEFADFTRLNDAYKGRFAFPYILAVRGRHRTEILDNFRSRVGNSYDQEFREALNQVHQIARLRLESLT